MFVDGILADSLAGINLFTSLPVYRRRMGGHNGAGTLFDPFSEHSTSGGTRFGITLRFE